MFVWEPVNNDQSLHWQMSLIFILCQKKNGVPNSVELIYPQFMFMFHLKQYEIRLGYRW